VDMEDQGLSLVETVVLCEGRIVRENDGEKEF